MKFFSTILAASVAALVVDAAPAAHHAALRAATKISASSVKSYALMGWGPQEKSANGADLVILDADVESAATINKLKSQGTTVICYISAGTLENFRSDKSAFTENAELAQKYKGFGGSETWFDVTEWEKLKDPMSARIRNAKGKGCDGLEFDNLDCYNNGCVKGASYETLKTKEIEYANWLANYAHSQGLSVGLKNAVELIDALLPVFDFAVNEQCMAYPSTSGKGKECEVYKKFTAQNKLVVNVEYQDHGNKACDMAVQYNTMERWQLEAVLLSTAHQINQYDDVINDMYQLNSAIWLL